jgi:hypothetical protein
VEGNQLDFTLWGQSGEEIVSRALVDPNWAASFWERSKQSNEITFNSIFNTLDVDTAKPIWPILIQPKKHPSKRHHDEVAISRPVPDT